MTFTLAQIAVNFLDLYQHSKSTQKSYLSTLQPLLRYCGSQPITEISFQDLELYFSTLQHLAPRTQQRHRTIINRLFNYAVEQGYLFYNPLTRLPKLSHHSSHSISYLTSEQLQVLYHALDNNPDEQSDRTNAIVRLLHSTGAKVSEILALTLTQIESENRRFQVTNQYHQTRWCFYSDDVAAILERYIQKSRLQSDHCLAVFTAIERQSKNITCLSYSMLYQDWRKLIQPYPILSLCRLNDLRHTFAIERVDLMGIEELQALMGHQDINMTLRYKF